MKTLLLSLIITPFMAMGQYEWYTALKIEELMLDPSNGAIQAAYNELDGERFFDTTRIQSLSNTEFDIFKDLTTKDLKLFSELYNLYYAGDTVLSVPVNYHDAKQLILKLDKNAEMQSAVDLNGAQISQAQVLTAITDVIIDRAKQELAKAFFDKLADSIKKGIPVWYNAGPGTLSFTNRVGTSDTIRLKEILSHTLACIENSKNYMTPEMGQTFKDALTKDLENLLPNFIHYGLPADFKRDELVDDYVLSSYIFIKQLTANAQFSIAANEFLESLISAYSGAVSPDTIQVNFYKLIKVLNTGFVKPDGDYVVNATAFRNASPETFRLFLHMLSNNEDLPVPIRTALSSYTNQASFNTFVSAISRLQFTLESIFKTKDSHEKIESLLPASQSFLDATIAGTDLYFRITGVRPSPEIRRYLGQAVLGVEFVTHLKNKNYSKAALNVIDFIDSTFQDPVKHELIKYISLIADISHAQNASEVRTIVDRAILPVGSYAIKRSTAFGMSVNSYCGLAGGFEWNVLSEKNSKNHAALGLSLPIGIAFNWSKGDEDQQKGSHTLFASLLDLGAIANYSLKSKDGSGSESVSNAPEISFANVFAPGLSYVTGLANLPISFSIGGQYLPRLREITGPGQIMLGEVDAIQLKLGILLDIPLFDIMLGGKN